MRNISNKKSVQDMAYENYKNNNPWPENDNWHASTHSIIEKNVINWLNKNTHENSICLNIGAGQSRYSVHGTLIQMDIISEYIENEPNYIVGSLESIPLETESVDFIVCVGSVLNYCDAIRSISEIERVLKISQKDSILDIALDDQKIAILHSNDILTPLVIDELFKTKQQYFVVMDEQEVEVRGIVAIEDIVAITGEDSKKAKEVMRSNFLEIKSDKKCLDVLEKMLAKNSNFAVITRKNGDLAGVVHIHDFLKNI